MIGAIWTDKDAERSFGLWSGADPFRFVPGEITFKLGGMVNSTLILLEESEEAHTFTIRELGIIEGVKYGKPNTFTYTFDKPGTFRLVCETYRDTGMLGYLTVQ